MSNDAEVDRIMSLSDEELLAEIKEQGLDPKEVADRGRAAFRRALAQVDADALQDDLQDMLAALGMPGHARPYSPHRVFQEALIEMKRQLAAGPRSAASTVTVAANCCIHDVPLVDECGTCETDYGNYRTVTVRPAAPTTSPEPDAVRDRDRIAAIIEPEALAEYEAEFAKKTGGPTYTMMANYPQVKAARDKADAILTALSRPAHGGWQDISTAPVEPWSKNQPSYYRFNCLMQNAKGWVSQGYGHYTTAKHKLVWKEQGGSAFDPIYWMPLPLPRNDRGSEA